MQKRKTEWIVRATPQEAQLVADRAAKAGRPTAVWLRHRALLLAKACEKWTGKQLEGAMDVAEPTVRYPRTATLRVRVTEDEAEIIENGRQVLELRLREMHQSLTRSQFSALPRGTNRRTS